MRLYGHISIHLFLLTFNFQESHRKLRSERFRPYDRRGCNRQHIALSSSVGLRLGGKVTKHTGRDRKLEKSFEEKMQISEEATEENQEGENED